MFNLDKIIIKICGSGGHDDYLLRRPEKSRWLGQAGTFGSVRGSKTTTRHHNNQSGSSTTQATPATTLGAPAAERTGLLAPAQAQPEAADLVVWTVATATSTPNAPAVAVSPAQPSKSDKQLPPDVPPVPGDPGLDCGQAAGGAESSGKALGFWATERQPQRVVSPTGRTSSSLSDDDADDILDCQDKS